MNDLIKGIQFEVYPTLLNLRKHHKSMKKLKHSIIAVLFTCTLFAISPAKADDPGAPCGGADVDSPCGGGGDSSLPIDTYIWYLVAAAGIIGTRVVLHKNRKRNAIEI